MLCFSRGLQHVILCEDFCIILEKKVSQKMGNLLNFWLVVLLLVTGWMLALDKTKNLVNCWFFFLNYCKKCVFYLIISLFLKLLQSPTEYTKQKHHNKKKQVSSTTKTFNECSEQKKTATRWNKNLPKKKKRHSWFLFFSWSLHQVEHQRPFTKKQAWSNKELIRIHY